MNISEKLSVLQASELVKFVRSLEIALCIFVCVGLAFSLGCFFAAHEVAASDTEHVWRIFYWSLSSSITSIAFLILVTSTRGRMTLSYLGGECALAQTFWLTTAGIKGKFEALSDDYEKMKIVFDNGIKAEYPIYSLTQCS